MTTDADRWVEAQLARGDRHPDWPADGPAVATEAPGRLWGPRWAGWIVRHVSQPIPEAQAAGGPWLRLRLGEPPVVDVTARIWALRADAPDAGFWWELLWSPGAPDLELTPYGSGRVPVDRARTLLVDGLDLVHGVRQGRESLDVVVARLEPIFHEQFRLYRRLSAGRIAKRFGLNRQYFAYDFLPGYGVAWARLRTWRPGTSLYRLAGLPDPAPDTTRQPGGRD